MSARPPAPTEKMQGEDPRGPTLVEVAEEGQFYVDAIVVGATIVPGFVLCVPGLVFVIVPFVALGLVAATAALAVLVAVAPVRLGRRIAPRLRQGVAARSGPQAPTVPPAGQAAARRAEGLPADEVLRRGTL